MLPTLYAIQRIGDGKLSVMGRPRAGDWASEEFSALAGLGVAEVVSLLEPSEARELGLEGEASLCGSAGIAFRSFPIPDRGQPQAPGKLSRLACEIYHRCAQGGHVVVHCRAGIGRSGLVAAAVLLHSGLSPAEAFSVVSKGRGVSVPDTEEQAEWLVADKSAISACHLAAA